MKELLEQKSREDLEREIIELKRQLVEAYEMIRKLSEQIEELQRAGKRQAVPFARRDAQRVKKAAQTRTQTRTRAVQEPREAESGRNQRDEESGIERLPEMRERTGRHPRTGAVRN